MLFWKKMVKKFDAFSPLIPPRYFRVQYLALIPDGASLIRPTFR